MSSSKIPIINSVKRQLTELNWSLKNKKLTQTEVDSINNKIQCLENIFPELEKQLKFSECYDVIVTKINWYNHMNQTFPNKLNIDKTKECILILTKLL
jgi:flagellin-specific chaperone FliS